MSAIKSIANNYKLKEKITSASNEETYRSVRRLGLKVDSRVRKVKTILRQQIVNNNLHNNYDRYPKSGRLHWEIIEPVIPGQAYKYNYHLFTRQLTEFGVKWWLVKGLHHGRYVIGISESDRQATLVCLQNFALTHEKPLYAMDAGGRNPQFVMTKVAAIRELANTETLRCVAPRRSIVDGRRYGFAFGVDFEFWDLPNVAADTSWITAPRENQAARSIGSEDFELLNISQEQGSALTPAVFSKSFLEDVDFEIDAVYTWVDDSDEKWQESRLRLLASISGIDFHPEATQAARFHSRDELKYSLRSISYYAPWFRNIYIVTADQVPSWLNTNNPRVKVVSHREIFNAEDLPTFNSNAIISRLHHIKELSEHFVYINDDVLFGKPVVKQDFFTSGGVALVSPSNNRRPFGLSDVSEGPHFNLTRNIRELLENEFGKTISRAIKHTPHPMIKSLHFEMEEKFHDAYVRTWASRFRHHEDIVADQLHHYYSQLVGRAVPGRLTYNYINIQDSNYIGVLQDTLASKNRHVFCLNDAPDANLNPIPEDMLRKFFESYFPVKSEFEK